MTPTWLKSLTWIACWVEVIMCIVAAPIAGYHGYPEVGMLFLIIAAAVAIMSQDAYND